MEELINQLQNELASLGHKTIFTFLNVPDNSTAKTVMYVINNNSPKQVEIEVCNLCRKIFVNEDAMHSYNEHLKAVNVQRILKKVLVEAEQDFLNCMQCECFIEMLTVFVKDSARARDIFVDFCVTSNIRHQIFTPPERTLYEQLQEDINTLTQEIKTNQHILMSYIGKLEILEKPLFKANVLIRQLQDKLNDNRNLEAEVKKHLIGSDREESLNVIRANVRALEQVLTNVPRELNEFNSILRDIERITALAREDCEVANLIDEIIEEMKIAEKIEDVSNCKTKVEVLDSSLTSSIAQMESLCGNINFDHPIAVIENRISKMKGLLMAMEMSLSTIRKKIRFAN
jgi:hypothetical protein